MASCSPAVVVTRRASASRSAALTRFEPVEPTLGELQQFTPASEALYVPDIDESLDEEAAKRAFWAAFKVLGEWYADLPPY